jgi:hypothetical protein
MYWKKQKHKQNNNARLTKEWPREKSKMQNAISLLDVMTDHLARLHSTAASENLNEF